MALTILDLQALIVKNILATMFNSIAMEVGAVMGSNELLDRMQSAVQAMAETAYLDQLYDCGAAAKRLGVSESCVRSYWREGKLERVKVGWQTRVSERGIRAFLARSAAENHRHNATAARAGKAGKARWRREREGKTGR
jgi:hypothetical protein